MKEFAKRFYKSAAWRKCREAYIQERLSVDFGLCEECHKRLGYIVHHKILLTPENINDANITLNFDNLKYVCKKCHDIEEVHPFVKVNKLKCSFDDNGQPISPPENG